MPNKLLILILLAGIATFTGCRKDPKKQMCVELTDAMAINDVATVKTVITEYIDRLLSETHTAENLQKLAESISGECNITIEVLCYGCIKTLPEMSEIRLTFQTAGTTMHRIIDISSTSTSNQRMKFVAMH